MTKINSGHLTIYCFDDFESITTTVTSFTTINKKGYSVYFRISSSQIRKSKYVELEENMGVMKIIMVTMMMMLLVGTIRETKATSPGYAACVKHCNDLCAPKFADKNCVPNCIFFRCGPALPRNFRHAKVNIQIE